MSNQLLESSIIDAKTQLKSLIPSTVVLEKVPVEGYEQIIRVTDTKRGLVAFIAIHNTVLGPALGGTRIFPYTNEAVALQDALRLSRGMTYKASISGVSLGGGKSVIIADPKSQKTKDLLLAFGEAVDLLKGQYICAEDVGCSTEDVKVIRKATQYVVGLPQEKSSGDPGFFTAWGVFRGIQSVCKKLFGSSSVEGKKVAVQGLGNVGRNLIDYLFWAGAELIISDIDQALVQKYAKKYGAKAVAADQILKTECDILAPCAMGGILNGQTIPELRCKAVAGAANNQLLSDKDAETLSLRGILYAPDFVINAGGLLNVAAEIEEDGYCPVRSRGQCHRIYDTLLSIYEVAERNKISTHAAAIALGDERIRLGIGKRLMAPVFHHTAE
jgi:leucine dehydrogenase